MHFPSYFKALTTAILLLASLGANSSAFADNALIVNANNPYTATESDMRELVKRLFLKRQSAWPNGATAKCFDRSRTSNEQTTFNQTILEMSDAVIARHWLRLKQTTGETPPRNVGSTNVLSKFVSKYDGGMGVVAENELATLPETVRVLFRF